MERYFFGTHLQFHLNIQRKYRFTTQGRKNVGISELKYKNMTDVYASKILVCFSSIGKCEYLYVIAELYFHTFEEGLEVQTPKTNPAAVTLLGCPVERASVAINVTLPILQQCTAVKSVYQDIWVFWFVVLELL